MSLAVGKLAIPVLAAVALFLAGGSAKADPTKAKAAYDAGFAQGKSDKEKSVAESLNPGAGLYTGAELAAYAKGYKDGYAAGVKPSGPPPPKKPQYNGVDTETISQAQTRGNIQGLADGRQDGSFGNPMGTTRTKPSYTRDTLIAAYWNAYNPAYPSGYAEGKSIKDAGGGGIMGDVLGTQGDSPANFRPMQSARHYYDQRRPGGYPPSWYNY